MNDIGPHRTAVTAVSGAVSSYQPAATSSVASVPSHHKPVLRKGDAIDLVETEG